jgi:adenine-specific DNA glycosylase
VQVDNPEDVGGAWIEHLRYPDKAREMGATAKRLVEESRGATDRAMKEIAKFLGGTSR